jgi:16S rRNA (uracil1498-N3)-methyltransferase
VTPPHLFAAHVDADRIEIVGDDARHAVRVLRLRRGEAVTISDGAGTVVDAVIADAGPTLVAAVTARRFVERPRPMLTVVQGIPKASKFDEIVQHLVEIGADLIVPLRAHRSIPRWDGDGKVQRSRTIAHEAAKQSRRAWLPLVADPVDLADAPIQAPAFVLHEEAATGLIDALPARAPDGVTLFVGPEGGFDPKEVELLTGRGATAVTLGSQILRAETAPIVAGTLVLGRYGRLG